MTDINTHAATNFAQLDANPYPGRIIVMGLNEAGTHVLQLYAITGRSESSKNRVLTLDGGRLFTELAKPDPKADTRLIIYNAMDEIDMRYIVSNGDQTDSITRSIRSRTNGAKLQIALQGREYEPDGPNFTPRIAAVYSRSMGDYGFQFSVLNKTPYSNDCEHHHSSYDHIAPGFGFGIMTYTGDAEAGQPLPTFAGRPFLLPLKGDLRSILGAYMEALPADKVVAGAIKMIEIKSGESEILIHNTRTKE
jgi:IMP cyclohydrolase